MGFFNDYCPGRVPGPDQADLLFRKVIRSSRCTRPKLSSTDCGRAQLSRRMCPPPPQPPDPTCPARTCSGHTPPPRPPTRPASPVSPSAKPTSVQHPASHLGSPSGLLTGGDHPRAYHENTDVTALIESPQSHHQTQNPSSLLGRPRTSPAHPLTPQPAAPTPDTTLDVLSLEAGTHDAEEHKLPGRTPWASDFFPRVLCFLICRMGMP